MQGPSTDPIENLTMMVIEDLEHLDITEPEILARGEMHDGKHITLRFSRSRDRAAALLTLDPLGYRLRTVGTLYLNVWPTGYER